ncbi:hypothetical protein OPT61_g1360 [Boeremia exigua]|uniref:Uncharacterized protein n=1 Tax=Boeremia exigua TaxID=749465 RepID=A0ACC2IQM1_9PLEO|nr:hypothetical protein OPT61_g1360 [Boeremia exigua]
MASEWANSQRTGWLCHLYGRDDDEGRHVLSPECIQYQLVSVIESLLLNTVSPRDAAAQTALLIMSQHEIDMPWSNHMGIYLNAVQETEEEKNLKALADYLVELASLPDAINEGPEPKLISTTFGDKRIKPREPIILDEGKLWRDIPQYSWNLSETIQGPEQYLWSHSRSKTPLAAMQAWKNVNTYLALLAVHPGAQTIPALANMARLGPRTMVMALEYSSGTRLGKHSELHAPAALQWLQIAGDELERLCAAGTERFEPGDLWTSRGGTYDIHGFGSGVEFVEPMFMRSSASAPQLRTDQSDDVMRVVPSCCCANARRTTGSARINTRPGAVEVVDDITSPEHSTGAFTFLAQHVFGPRLSHIPIMWTAFAPLLLAPLAFALPDTLAAFEPALEPLNQLTTSNNETNLVDSIAELVKRQNNVCGSNNYQCSNAPSLCCPRTAVCSADVNNIVGCCPQGKACTGTLGAATTGAFPASTTAPFVSASTTSGPFIQTTTVAGGASTVSNAFYPFPYIATTYSNAAACSSAYTRCQSDAASCTNALIGGAQGVTISAPNGGATITGVPSLGVQSASSICASLSQEACYGLQVEACQAFDGSGNAAPTRCGGYIGAVGVALGVAGQLL